MTGAGILRDNKENISMIEFCKYCRNGIIGEPRIILPEDQPLAIRMPNGSYNCHECLVEGAKNILRKQPSNLSAQKILAEQTAQS